MTAADETNRSWRESVRAIFHPRAIAMLFLGLSAGLPILLIFSSLSLWLREAGLSKSAVTMFSWAALGYSFKFVWAPLIDRLPVPVLTRALGRRRAWILVAQLLIIAAICWMAATDPQQGSSALTTMAFAAVMLGVSSATQDIVIDAYRIESVDADMQAMLSATYIAGYRIGMVIAGAGAIYIAEKYGSTKDSYSYDAWRTAYLSMAGVMLVGVATTLFIREPDAKARERGTYATRDYARFVLLFALAVGGFIATFMLTAKDVAPLGTALVSMKGALTEVTGNKALAGFLVETLRLLVGVIVAVIIGMAGLTAGVANRAMVTESYVDPVRDFFRRYGTSLAVLLLALIGLYRISDIVLGVIANVFYQDMGYSKTEIAAASKTFGLLMTIVGGFAGGILALRYGVMRILFAGALLTVATNLLFILLSEADLVLLRTYMYSTPQGTVDLGFWAFTLGGSFDLSDVMLYVVLAADNLTAGLASAAFVAFLSSLTNVSFTAVQYAIFSSLMTLIPKIIGGYSGTIVDSVGYTNFFIVSSALGVPVLALVWLAGRRLEVRDRQSAAEVPA